MGSLVYPRGNGIVFRRRDGIEGRGGVVSLTRDSLVFEVYSPHFEVAQGQAVPELTIYRGGKPIYSGGAAVRSILSSGRVLTVSATPLGDWAAADVSPPGDTAQALVRDWENSHALLPDFELAVTRLRSFLVDLSRWVASADTGSPPPAMADPMRDGDFGGCRNSHLDRLPPQNSDQSRFDERYIAAVEDWCAAIHPRLRHLFANFEDAARRVPPGQWEAHRAFTQEELHPLTLCAPFVHRTYAKPLGYPGDYEMVNMILRNRPEGPSMFAGIVNAYFLRLPVAQGHRNRIDRLADTLRMEAARPERGDRAVRVLNLGCGPAVEISRFIRTSPLASRCEFTLIDFNRETIDHATEQLSAAMRESGRYPAVRGIQQSVSDLLKDVAMGSSDIARGGFDVVYCAGLFDYLSDRLCSRLLEMMYRQAAPGGLVVATNVHPEHGAQAALDALGEWNLLLRTEADMRRLAQNIAAEVSTGVEPAGTNVFLELRKSLLEDVSAVTRTRRHPPR